MSMLPGLVPGLGIVKGMAPTLRRFFQPKATVMYPEMAPDVALNPALQVVFPFSRLTGPANVLIMPGLQTANISAKLLKELGGGALIGPMLVGMKQQAQIAPMTATASDLVTLAVLAAGRIVR